MNARINIPLDDLQGDYMAGLVKGKALVFGRVGTGKTTLLASAIEEAQKCGKKVVVVEARDELSQRFHQDGTDQKIVRPSSDPALQDIASLLDGDSARTIFVSWGSIYADKCKAAQDEQAAANWLNAALWEAQAGSELENKEVLFIIDELHSLPPIPALKHAFCSARSTGVAVIATAQGGERLLDHLQRGDNAFLAAAITKIELIGREL